VLQKNFGIKLWGANIVPNTLVTIVGHDWRRHRLAMNPFFAEAEFIDFFESFMQIAKEEYEALEEDKLFKIHDWTDIITIRVLLKSLFQVDLNIKNDEDKQRLEQCRQVIGPWMGGVLTCSVICSPLLKTQAVKKFIQKKLQPIKDMVSYVKDNPNENNLFKKVSSTGKLTWEELECEGVLLMMVGMETTSSTLCYILQCLSQHPEVKKKLKQELDDVLQGRLPTYNDLPNLKYLEKVILETLRYHPAIQVMVRTALEHELLGDYIIPKDSIIFFSPGFVVRHDGEDPDTFNPDRYTDENVETASRSKIHPAFGSGPHVCIGRHLALLELKALTAYIIQNGDIETDIKECKTNPHFLTQQPVSLTATKKSM